MGIRHYKPTSPGRRGMMVLTTEDLTKKKPERALTESLSSTGGRNNLGEITVWHRGGGHKRKYRIIDFKREQARTSPRRSRRWNTIPTGPRASRS